jgi:hypothetical protein
MTDEHEVARYGAWWASVRCVAVKAFPDREPLWFWYVGHDRAGVLWSGRGLDHDLAVEAATAELTKVTS